MNDKKTTPDSNRDPITGKSGSHPVGTGVGAAGGGTLGAAVGSIAGPAGTLAGGAIGAVAGGLAGKGVAEKINPTVEDNYWRSNFATASYVRADYGYEDYAPAYKLGWERAASAPGTKFEDVENDLGRDWDRYKGKSRLTWENAKSATRAAWMRTSDAIERAAPGDSDRDGK